MKQLFTLLSAIILTTFVSAQAPESMSYQAVVRDAGNALVTNQAIGMKISISDDLGFIVYSETQTPTSNNNGLVSVEVGTGTIVSGLFSSIDWGNGTYFIETNIDPTGGTIYTITASSQLLSVPYALHAKTVETFDYNDLTNAPTYSIGDYVQGGVIFWLDQSGQHGLVCAIQDAYNGNIIGWDCGSNGQTKARGPGTYAGEMNTSIIISSLVALDPTSTCDYAALKCSEIEILQGGVFYSDWYLPAVFELSDLYNSITIVNSSCVANGGNALQSLYYWSSTEYGPNDSYQFSMGGLGFSTAAKSGARHIRPIRSF